MREEIAMFARLIFALCVVLSCVSHAACQSELRVRVEKLEGVQSRAADPAVDALVLIREAIVGLDEICTECRATYGDDTVNAALATLADAQRQARMLRPIVEDLIARQSRGEI